VFLAAAGQRTRRVELGTAVIPIGYESPFRLAEDLALADVLSRGRLQVGFSSGMPHAELLGDLVYDGDWRGFELGYGRIARLIQNLRGHYLGDQHTIIHSPGNTQRPRLQPHNPGLVDRIWYGGGSLRSAQWAGEQRMNFLSSNVVRAEESEDFAEIQRSHIETFRAHHPAGEGARVSQGLVVIPTDTASAEQRARYAAYAESRLPRTASPQGPARMMFAPDLLGTSEQIAEALYAHAGFREVREVVFALPFSFEPADYVQILTDMATRLGPTLGWQPPASR
jgi:alkanesulfonate monooxygenase SsuD/methylene tetrahydromethanopterin reductase-like flavin-dependent oxidoreductase (luciferase family)